ncbi:hypothetical protein G6O69_28645 [Pseudenhygromyxa sp. WMMC2535]|uniref:hypothetical protein n=1 Tax=Pseudenhygromyxa sp. WMMC2535 TaxID=2712867 RepID=UPI0015557B4F|nr:hypothetical protein [Pseudenhygromyxa sp. WMMC2535]NVB41836.1 hypothetical protein [Pseudenhygromyxa sp. WMMC2535]
MALSPTPVPRRLRVRVSLLASLLATTTTLAAATAGCVRGGGRSEVPGAKLVADGWIDASTMGEATLADPDRLAALAEAGPQGRVIRLDRLLDLYDAARFAEDREARESLWIALGGNTSTRGIDASREVVLRLLDEAYRLDDLAASDPAALDDDARSFVADAIMLLSTDMFLPDSAEALITQTLAYRVLTEQGHPRIADNAHWRLYDHVRGVLEGAVDIGPQLRDEIAVHALYAEREDISAWLEDRAPHAQPPLPEPAALWTVLARHRDALAEIPRWQGVVASRAAAEAELRETTLALLPQPRDPAWVLPELPQGTGVRESLAPVVLARPGELVLEPSGVEPRSLPASASAEDPEALRAGLEGLLARDGRGVLLFAADPQLPAPELEAALSALAEARTSTIELAVHEPRIGEGAEPVVVALPLHVARPDDLARGVRALRESRIHVQLSGRGPRFAIDGRWLSASSPLPSDIEALAQTLRAAYPRERALSLSLAGDVQPRQLVDLLAALSGGVSPAFLAVGWTPDVPAQPTIAAQQPEADALLDSRAALGRARLEIAIEAPDGLPADDLARVEQAADATLACVPELEAALPAGGLPLNLHFEAGQLATVELQLPRRDARLARNRASQIEHLEACAQDRLLGFHLSQTPDESGITLRLTAKE